jgi:RHS repeat-associated protein
VLAYDAAGNLAWSAAGLDLPSTTACDTDHGSVAARKVVRLYDARNRPTELRFPDGLGDTVTGYTPDGQPVSITAYNGSAVVTNTYEYNRRRLPTRERMQVGGIDWSVHHEYNANGHPSRRTILGLALDYAPNALGQPTQVGAYATGVSYFPNGALKQFTYGNGIVHTLTQNARGLPERSRDAYGSTAFLDDSYDFDANGNVAAISDGATGQNQRGNRTMSYDGLDRLTATVSPMFGSGGAVYAYDALDNLTRVNIGGTAARDHHYCYDGRNQLTNVKTGGCGGSTVIGLGYDVQGNVANKNGDTFSFDYGNRLRSATVGGVTSSYIYDGHGRRVRDVTGAGKFSLYTRDGQLAYVHNARENKQQWHVYLGGSLVATREQDTVTGAVAEHYLHTDALGSPVAITDESRTVIQRSEYEPYGAVLNRAHDDRPGYTGHVADAATGLVQMQQRYFWPEGGIFLSVDAVTPFENPVGQFHRYRYANNNPYTFTDPDGRVAVPGFVIGVGLELVRQAVTGEIKDTSLSGIARNAGKALIAGASGAAGGGIATGVAKLSTSVAVRAAANGAAGAGIGATSRVATNAVEGKPLSDGVAGSAAIGAVAGMAGSGVGDAIEGPAAQRLANATGNFIGTPAGQVAAPAVAAGVVSKADAAATVIANSPGTAEAAARAVRAAARDDDRPQR